MLHQGSERSQYGLDAGLDVTLAAAQGRQPERDQGILKITQIMPAQRQILQQVACARVPVRLPPRDPRTPALRRLQQLLADRREPRDQRSLLARGSRAACIDAIRVADLRHPIPGQRRPRSIANQTQRPCWPLDYTAPSGVATRVDPSGNQLITTVESARGPSWPSRPSTAAHLLHHGGGRPVNWSRAPKAQLGRRSDPRSSFGAARPPAVALAAPTGLRRDAEVQAGQQVARRGGRLAQPQRPSSLQAAAFHSARRHLWSNSGGRSPTSRVVASSAER
jgi:hypothetical protein